MSSANSQLEPNLIDALHRAAREAAAHAYAPYSNFPVGAALLDENGRVHAGCNVENASYGLSLCAERAAMAAAVAAGARRLRAVAVFTPGALPITPCGACRQVLAELADPSMEIHLLDGAGGQTVTRLAELLPAAFRLDQPGDASTGSSGS